MNSETINRPERGTGGASSLNLIAALWLIISPWVLAFTINPTAMWNNIAVGIAIGVIAAIRLSAEDHPGWSWANAALGVWLIVSPCAFAFATAGAVMWNNVIVGALVTIIAISSGAGSPTRPTTPA